MKISRRNFLKSTGLAFALLPLSQGTASSFSRIGNEDVSSLQNKSVPTICALCPARCLMIGKTSGRKILGLYGNKNDKYTGGKLCARGYAAVKILTDPNRLKYPLKRVGERGEGKWARIQWGEAIDTICANLKKTILKNGPEAVGLFAGGPSSKFIAELFSDLGIGDIANARHELCFQSRNAALLATFGTENASLVTRKMAEAKCIVLFGSHFGENVQTGILKNYFESISKGAKVIVVDPRTSVIAGKADHHLMIRPGTDTALLLGWINYIISNGFYNKNFIENYTSGIKALQEKAAEYPFDRVASLTDLPVEELRLCAELISTSSPDVLIYPGNFTAWYGNDVQRLRSLAILNALLADKGTFSHFFGKGERQKNGIDLLFEKADPYAVSSRVTSSALVREAGKGRIKILCCWGQNPFQSIPNPHRTRAAFKKAEFTFCCDILPTEASLYADIILPEASFLERMDDIETWQNQENRAVALRYPVVEPLYESKDPYYIVRQLSSRLGAGKRFEYDKVERRIDADLKKSLLSCDYIRRNDGVVFQSRKNLMFTPDDLRFPTPSGRIELYSEALASGGEAPVPDYVPTGLPPKGFLRLLNGKSPVHYGSACNNEWLNHEISENELWLNDEVATKTGIRDGDRLVLENQDGIRSTKAIKIKVTPGIRVDCVFLAHGFGAGSPFLVQGFNRGVSDNPLVTRSHPDPVSGARGIRVNFVRLVRGGVSIEMPMLDSPPKFLEEKTRWWFDSFGSYENGRNRPKYV